MGFWEFEILSGFLNIIESFFEILKDLRDAFMDRLNRSVIFKPNSMKTKFRLRSHDAGTF